MSLDPGFTTVDGRRIFGLSNRLAKMLEVEAALARASASVGVIPAAAAAAIGEQCRPDRFDARSLFAEGWEAGSPVIPLVARLRELVGDGVAEHVHRGATTQDIVDTAAMLQAREGLDRLDVDLLALGRSLAVLAERHRETPALGRTLMQPAAPTTFGLAVAAWLDAVTRDVERTRDRRRGLALQLGGPVGDLAGLGERGLTVAVEMARLLGLAVPAMPWHSTRDRIGETAAALALLCQSLTKIAGDLVLLAQAEVGEVSMRGGGSSALPRKRNPIDAIRTIAAARFASAQAAMLLAPAPFEHQRPAGGWQAEWVAVPTLFQATLAAVEALGRALDTLEVDAERMRDNLGASAVDRGGAGLADRFVDRVLAAFGEVAG